MTQNATEARKHDKNFKVFADPSGNKALQFSIQHDLRKDENGKIIEDKGHKIVAEFTSDGWTTKSYFFFEKHEAESLLSVLAGKTKSNEFSHPNRNLKKEKSGMKKAGLENQNTHFYFKASVPKDSAGAGVHGFRLLGYDVLRLRAMLSEVISINLKNDLGVKLSAEAIFASYDKCGRTEQGSPVSPQERYTPKADAPELKPISQASGVEVKPVAGQEYVCSACSKKITLKIKEFSEKKNGKALCMDCQKK